MEEEKSLGDLKAELAKLQEQFNAPEVVAARQKAKELKAEQDKCYAKTNKIRDRIGLLFTEDGQYPRIFHNSCSGRVENNILPEVMQKLSKTINLKVLTDSQVEEIVRKLVNMAVEKDAEKKQNENRIAALGVEISKVEEQFERTEWAIENLEARIEDWKPPEIVKAQKQVIEQKQSTRQKKLSEREAQYNKAMASLEGLLKEVVPEKA